MEAGKHCQGICRELSSNIPANHRIYQRSLNGVFWSDYGITSCKCYTERNMVLFPADPVSPSWSKFSTALARCWILACKLQHSLIISRLRQFNISSSLLSWFTSYLSGRKQRVTVLGATSQERVVTSGVPQGSIIWPVLFLLYVNDLPKAVLSSKVVASLLTRKS